MNGARGFTPAPWGAPVCDRFQSINQTERKAGPSAGLIIFYFRYRIHRWFSLS